ncbi:helix-turn-helix transcriptional regulator [Secundilactobacillus malefermentans]|uniref:HTH deoR-type domain-containing protein n=1 Tax=Secundilactobacillus malefermentans TaxID=176292 RepID=A0A4V3A2W9_9LACO|nr:WYL domain-containing protein [Secundilactobacillus malefermentans]KRM58580.1 transcriptional regulator [Secundilactobacillus malefermentans DSM 5705 = KCTC 3548]QEA31099.1 WYL domain-containing protein [Secundilactobacillus malefermentans]TDG71171.1 hypothetical protein C5L31_001858 [Secundilactobacillus malefermentans]
MNKSERLNQELIFLRDKHTFQLKNLMAEFEISKRTALRDIEELESMGLALYGENGRSGGYRLINQTPLIPVYFNSEETQAIFFALDALKAISATPFNESYQRIQKKLMATILPERQKNVTKMLAAVHYYNAEQVTLSIDLEKLLDAIFDEKVVNVTYTQHERSHLQLQILELFYRNGIWFTSAFDFVTQQWGTYRCDYMFDLSTNKTVKTTYSRLELQQIQDQYENKFHNIPFRCRLTAYGKELFLKHHYPNMHLEVINDIPYMVGGYNQTELDYMTHFLISFGKHMHIEYPKQLQESYLNQLDDIRGSYI